MIDRKKISSLVNAKVSKLDPNSIVQGAMYDEASGRVIVTIVKGPRRTLTVLAGRWFEDGAADRVESALKEALKRLDEAPIG